MGLEIVGRLDDLDCSPDHLINQLFPVKSDDKKVTASTPDKQQDAAMAEDKKVTNSTPDEQQDADFSSAAGHCGGKVSSVPKSLIQSKFYLGLITASVRL